MIRIYFSRVYLFLPEKNRQFLKLGNYFSTPTYSRKINESIMNPSWSYQCFNYKHNVYWH